MRILHKRLTAEASPAATTASLPNRILGSLRDALNAAARDTNAESADPLAAGSPLTKSPPPEAPAVLLMPAPPTPEALIAVKPAAVDIELAEPATRLLRSVPRALRSADEVGRTQAVRGKPKVSHAAFHQDPVVGWLVVVGGPGLGAFRPIYEGNNTLGRARGQRIAIDFGDASISGEEQAYIRYDSVDRAFLFVPNLAKTNIVSINSKKPTGAVPLQAMDVITVGHTQLAFVPFCGEEFDWSELTDLKE
ncbi:MAG TPA: FHA domain-containing protein [Hyphomicrobiaceae bacterium]|nr:FHA domain-containing protein [Hyphomicrobiaceae bacterium]